MSKIEKGGIDQYIELCDIVKKRLEQHNQIFSINKQHILKILFDSKAHLCTDDISLVLRSLPLSTINRVLTTFEFLGIVECIVIDEIKRYELIYLKQPHYHLYCQECHTISEFESLEIHKLFLQNLEKMNFKATSFNVIINGICSKCQNDQ